VPVDVIASDDAGLPRRPLARLEKDMCRIAVDRWKALAAILVVIVGVSAYVSRQEIDEHRDMFIVGLVVVLWSAVLVARTVVARQRRAEACAWPRLKLYRPAFYEWETHAWRWWAVPVAQWVAAALGGAAILADGGTSGSADDRRYRLVRLGRSRMAGRFRAALAEAALVPSATSRSLRSAAGTAAPSREAGDRERVDAVRLAAGASVVPPRLGAPHRKGAPAKSRTAAADTRHLDNAMSDGPPDLA
jgi:hypothetical protein